MAKRLQEARTTQPTAPQLEEEDSQGGHSNAQTKQERGWEPQEAGAGADGPVRRAAKEGFRQSLTQGEGPGGSQVT